jgi:hypothetical protein
MRQERGQAILPVMALAIVLAVALFATLSVWQAARSKIEVQTAADTAAYSVAVTEARTFNYFAVTNRAMASHFVAEMLLYGEISYLSSYDHALKQAENAWNRVSALEAAPFCFPMRITSCCQDIQPSSKRADQFGNEHKQIHQQLRNADQILQAAAAAHDTAAQMLMASQDLAWSTLKSVVEQQSIPTAIGQKLAGDRLLEGAPRPGQGAAAKETLQELNDAVEVRGDFGVNDISKTSNGSRFPRWVAKQEWVNGAKTIQWFNPGTDFEHMTFLSARGQAQSVGNAGSMSAVRKDIAQNDFTGQNPAKHSDSMGAETAMEGGRALPIRCVMAMQTFSAEGLVKSTVPSKSNDFLHEIDGKAESGPQDSLQTRHLLGDCNGSKCGVLPGVAHYKVSDSPDDLWKEPSAWVLMEAKPKDKSWRLHGGFSGFGDHTRSKFDQHITQTTASEQQNMAALARALVYYHRPDKNSAGDDHSWKEQPNFMNPFWRAKLELYKTGGKSQAAKQVLSGDGYTLASQISVPPAL